MEQPRPDATPGFVQEDRMLGKTLTSPDGLVCGRVIAVLMRTRVQIPHKRFLEKAFRWAPKTQTSTIWCPHSEHQEDRPNSARPCARRSSALS